MSIIADQIESESSVEFDEHFGGVVSSYHESADRQVCQTPTASDPEPGRFRLDDEPSEDAMNLQVREEVARLRREIPTLSQFGITPGLYWSGDLSQLQVDALPWQVTFFADGNEKTIGEGPFVGRGPTLGEAMTDAINMYTAWSRAKALDSVATSAEGRAA